MTTLVALVAVSVASILFRVVPLLGARRLPDRLARDAGWAGTSVLAAITVRAVLHHEDASLPVPAVIAAVSVGIGLLVAMRGRSVLMVLGSAVLSYLVLDGLVSALVSTSV